MTDKPRVLPFPVERNPDSTRYGQYYWLAGLADGREIGVMADAAQCSQAGALVFTQFTDPSERDSLNAARQPRETPINTLIIAPGQWTHAYAASVTDGPPVAIDRIFDPQPTGPAADKYNAVSQCIRSHRNGVTVREIASETGLAVTIQRLKQIILKLVDSGRADLRGHTGTLRLDTVIYPPQP